MYFSTPYKVISLAFLPSKTKETTFQTLNSTILTCNKAFKSGMAPDPTSCKEPETMEHLLYACENYSAKI
jgi:hypothetical protein